MSDKKALNKRNIKGKRIRPQDFNRSITLLVVMIIFTLICDALILPLDFMLALLCIDLVIILITIAAIFSLRKPLCILSKDRLYFFKQGEAVVYASVSNNRQKVLNCDGWILYSDIQKLEYNFYGIFSKVECCVVIYGADFKLTIDNVGKSFIRQVEEMRELSSLNREFEAVPRFTADTKTERSGLWKEIWEAFESGILEGAFDSDTNVTRLESNETVDTIDITLYRNHHEICFNIDNSSIYMYSPDNDESLTIYLNNILDIDNLFILMKDFINKNS